MLRALILAIVLFLIGTTIAINNYIKTQDQVPSSKEVFQPDEFHVSSQITIGQRTQPQFHETIVHAIPSLRSKNVLFVQQKLQCRINTTGTFQPVFLHESGTIDGSDDTLSRDSTQQRGLILGQHPV